LSAVRRQENPGYALGPRRVPGPVEGFAEDQDQREEEIGEGEVADQDRPLPEDLGVAVEYTDHLPGEDQEEDHFGQTTIPYEWVTKMKSRIVTV